MASSSSSDPFQVLGLPRDAGEEEVRARYLSLVRQFPPDREPERFREIRAAYEAARDPLVIAERLTRFPDEHPPRWEDAIEAEAGNPPPLSLDLLLSLGNRNAASP